MDVASAAESDADRPRASRAPRRAPSPFVQRYWAFLSYSHDDSADADWLHTALEKYRFPRALVGRGTAAGVVPQRLSPIFRDRQELAAGDLDNALIEALASSRVLIVLCSPTAATSRWTNEEIRLFKAHRPDGVVLAAIVSGEPWAADMPGHEAEECFPPALKQRFDARGRPTAERAEPIAADLRPHGDGRELGLLKLVAGMVGLRLDDLVQRDAQRRHRRMAIITTASVAAMLVASGLAFTAIQARDEARDQRREAEGLVGFMLGDLKDKLAPLGRLDALDAVGTRALAYFQGQDKGVLSEAALAQRGRALTMMGEIANTRGDLDGALRQYREALASTAEALRRKPADPQRMFDHAQNVYWVGYIDWQRGHLDRAEAAFREYQSLAKGMIAADPGKAKWQLEGIFADSNLGMVLQAKGDAAGSAQVFERTLSPVEDLLATQPRNRAYRSQLADTLAYLADSRAQLGRIDEAIAGRERELSLIADWSAADPGDADWHRMALAAHRALARWFAWRGQLPEAQREGAAATAAADRLSATEPGNTEWLEHSAAVSLDYGETLRLAGASDAAAAAVRLGCDKAERLLVIDRSVVAWSHDLREACLRGRARIALAAGFANEANVSSKQALTLAENDPRGQVGSAARSLASSLQLSGNVRAALGDLASARSDWQRAASLYSALPPTPDSVADHAIVARRLGDEAAVTALTRQLASFGYRQPDFEQAMKQVPGK